MVGNQIVKNVMMESKVRKRMGNMSLFERPEIVTLSRVYQHRIIAKST